MKRSGARWVPVLFSAGLVACGAASPVRDLVTEGRWGDACRALQGQEVGSRDMSEYEVAAELAGRSPVKLGVRALAAGDVEKRIAVLGGSLLRLAPFDPRMMGVLLDTAKSPPDDVFERDWLVVEVTLEVGAAAEASVGLAGVDLQERSRNTPDASHPWAPRWSEATPWMTWKPAGSKLSPEDDLAKSMGLLREPGASAPSLWSMLDLGALLVTGGIIDLKTRGADPLLLASTTKGRQPTAEERAAVTKLHALVGTSRCASVAPGASCTERVLLHRLTASRANALRVSLHYSPAKTPDACRLERSYPVPLPPARTVREQLAAVFHEKTRPVDEVEKLESAFQRSSDDCGGGDAKCPPVTDCAANVACSLQGQCAAEGGSCVARSTDCEATSSCQSSGYCEARAGACATPQVAAEGCGQACAWYGDCEKLGPHCAPGSAAQCAASIACKRFGACQKDGVSCAPLASADCAASEACRERGWCTLADKMCAAASDADCASASICKTYGACKASGGLCVSAP